MQRTISRTGRILTSALCATLLTAGAGLAQQAQAGQAKDPWKILDGTYYPPGTKELPLPQLPPEGEALPDDETVEGGQPAPLKGEWSAYSATYRQSLERLGEDDRDALLRVVADLEVAAVAQQPERRMPRLARIQLDIVRELAKQDPESLVPVFQLHHDLYLEHRKNRQWYLLHHSIAMVKELAELYVKKAGTQGARVTSARMLASLAGHLQAAQQPASVGLYEQVLELDPNNESAYLGLAAHHEKRGGPFEPVVAQLGRLLEIYPDHREGRLRLAINKLRLKKEKEARRLLQALVEEPSDDWVYRLAAQELARYESAGGRLGAAIRVLEQAVKRAPGDQKLCIQLAFFYDKNRQSYDAGRIAEVARTGPPAPEAPRGRYNTWPHKALDRDRHELRQMAQSRVQLLARLLERPGEGKPRMHIDAPESP